MKFRMKVSNGRREWWEKYDSGRCRCITDPKASKEKCAVEIIEFFNLTIHPEELPRTLVEVKEGWAEE